MSSSKLPVAVLGATGMVGQRFVTLLANHPWFEVTVVAASPRSAGKTYEEAVGDRWTQASPVPQSVARLPLLRVEEDLEKIASQVAVVFSAIDLEKKQVALIEEGYAAKGVAVISNNSAHRATPDVPMIIPEINPHHSALITLQRKRRNWSRGCIAVKPNCSLQSYVPLLAALESYAPVKEVVVTTMQAISGAGKTFAQWPEMVDNVIPFIKGEEQKSEEEPKKIFGTVGTEGIIPATDLSIFATCIRVPVSDGHTASVLLSLARPATKENLVECFKSFVPRCADFALPSAPQNFIHYFAEDDRPQVCLDRDRDGGMAISVGRLRSDRPDRWGCVGLSHNTMRGAAGGALLMAELLVAQGYIAR